MDDVSSSQNSTSVETEESGVGEDVTVGSTVGEAVGVGVVNGAAVGVWVGAEAGVDSSPSQAMATAASIIMATHRRAT